MDSPDPNSSTHRNDCDRRPEAPPQPLGEEESAQDLCSFSTGSRSLLEEESPPSVVAIPAVVASQLGGYQAPADSSNNTSAYESVLEDLRQRGLEDLAREILRLTDPANRDGEEDLLDSSTAAAAAATCGNASSGANDGSSNNNSQQDEKEVQPLIKDAHHLPENQSVVARLPPSNPNAEFFQLGQEVSQKAALRMGVPLATQGEGPDAGGKASGTAAAVGVPIPHRSARATETGALQNNSSSVVAAPSPPTAPTPPNPRRSVPSAPGAFMVTPRSNSSSGLMSDTSLVFDSSQFQQTELRQYRDNNNSSSNLNINISSIDSSSDHQRLEEGRSCITRDGDTSATSATTGPSQQQDLPVLERTSTGAALEAVRVDDITVKAEPLVEGAQPQIIYDRRPLCFKGVVCLLFTLLVVIGLALTNTRNDPSTAEATAAPTYDPDMRFELIQKLLLNRFAPIYDYDVIEHINATSSSNTTTTSGRQVLEQAFATPTSPQYLALEWIARKDPEIRAIAQPFLDVDWSETEPLDPDLRDAHLAAATASRSYNPDGPEGRRIRLLLQERRRLQVSHDRIVQRYALAVLYYANGGCHWLDSFEFLSKGHECDWSGALQCIHPDAEDAVTHINLGSNNLTGILPLELAALTHLQSLTLGSNALTGSLPSGWYRLSDLTTLDLGMNFLSGTIPDVYYENWIDLEAWNMASNDLTGTIPALIGNLVNLKSLQWNSLGLSGPMPQVFWSKLTNMEVLDLSQSTSPQKFINDTISTEIGRWSNLNTLQYHNLDLVSSIPSELGLLTKLSSVMIASNHFTGHIPSELGMLTVLAEMSLSMNALTGPIPSELVGLTSLERLFLQNTLLSGDAGFMCEAMDEGILLPMDQFRVDMSEVSGCYCCTCCQY